MVGYESEMSSKKEEVIILQFIISVQFSNWWELYKFRDKTFCGLCVRKLQICTSDSSIYHSGSYFFKDNVCKIRHETRESIEIK